MTGREDRRAARNAAMARNQHGVMLVALGACAGGAPVMLLAGQGDAALVLLVLAALFAFAMVVNAWVNRIGPWAPDRSRPDRPG